MYGIQLILSLVETCVSLCDKKSFYACLYGSVLQANNSYSPLLVCMSTI